MLLRPFLTAFATAALTMLACDALWLGTMNARLYRPAIGHLMSGQVVVSAAVLFYLLYLVGVVVLAVRPGTTDPGATWVDALWRGLLLGLVAYGTYDLTNQATLRDWPWHVTLIDLVWGGTLTALTAAIAHRVSVGR